MSEHARWIVILGVGVFVTAAASAAPLAFRRMEAFRVQQVEVRGTRYMAPEDALAATGITDSSSVFDDPNAWVEGLRAQRLIADARIEQRPPATVRIEVTETEPVALVRTPELRPVDARGRILPIAIAGEFLDAPILAGRSRFGDDSIADSLTVRLIGGLLAVRSHDPALARQVSEIGWASGGGLRVVLQEPREAELLLPERPDERTFREVRLAMEHLRSSGSTDASVIDRVARIDARYADELFVSLRSRRTN
jgi:POTRA domain, FtsQ-type